jgi:two-component system sensor histidine kinase KdpD
MPADLPLVEVDAALIQRVLVNLLENAVKHTPAGTPIEVRACRSNGNVLLEVSDAGPGLPPVAPEKLFDPFERGRKESSVAGAGLGLALARRIVMAHGGTIEARPRIPNGAVFAMTLPAPPPPQVEAA